MKQPTEIPGNYEATPQPLPDADWVITRKRPDFFIYGLFAYDGPYRELAQHVQEVGWDALRMAGNTLTKSDVEGIMDHSDCYVQLGGPKRDMFETDEQFIVENVKLAELRVARYWPQVDIYSIWNEPNLGYMWEKGSLDDRAYLYAKYLVRVSAVLRAKFEDITLIGFETGRAIGQNNKFVELVYAIHPEVHDAYDIFATHPGVDPAPPECDNVGSKNGHYSMAQHVSRLRLMWRTMRTGRKPIWFTEGGWHISQEEGGRYPSEAGHNVPAVLQAAYMCRYYAWAMRLGVERVYPFFIVDADGANGGFFNADKTPRTSAKAVQNMIRMMPAPKLVEVIHDGPFWYAYRFRKDALDEHSETVVMAWSIKVGPVLDISLGSNVIRVTDMLGAHEDIENPKGWYAIKVGPCPVWIEER